MYDSDMVGSGGVPSGRRANPGRCVRNLAGLGLCLLFIYKGLSEIGAHDLYQQSGLAALLFMLGSIPIGVLGGVFAGTALFAGARKVPGEWCFILDVVSGIGIAALYFESIANV